MTESYLPWGEWTMTSYDRDALIQLIKDQALEFGDFTLASGKKSTFYLDCRRVTLDARGATLIAAGMLELMAADMPDAVGGMAIGADPITGAIITAAYSSAPQLKGFIVRKEAKEHGKGRAVEGPVEPGQRAIIVEDTITTGGSALKAIARAREFGLEVIGALAVVDRLEGGAEAFAEVGVPLRALLTIHDLGVQPS